MFVLSPLTCCPAGSLLLSLTPLACPHSSIDKHVYVYIYDLQRILEDHHQRHLSCSLSPSSMFYHVIALPLNQNSSEPLNPSTSSQRKDGERRSSLMPRYHYSRTVPDLAAGDFDAFAARNPSNGHTFASIVMPMPTTNGDEHPYGSFKSTFIPLSSNSRLAGPTTSRREFIQIPITREDGTSILISNPTRTVPITYRSESSTGHLSPIVLVTNGNTKTPASFTSKCLVRPMNSRNAMENITG